MTNLDNYPCTCGHNKKEHRSNYYGDRNVCLVSNDSPILHKCVFKLDNLKYLEQQYEKSL